MSEQIKYIEKVEISKLWGKFDIEWNLHKDVNILGGGNGSGKTTILDCIASVILGKQLKIKYEGHIEQMNVSFNEQKKVIYKFFRKSLQDVEKEAITDNSYKILNSKIKNNFSLQYPALELDNIEVGIGQFSFENSNSNEIAPIVVDIISLLEAQIVNFDFISRLSNASSNNIKTNLDFNLYILQKLYLDYQINLSKRKDEILDNSENPKRDIAKLRWPHLRFLAIIDELFGATGKKVNREENEVSFLLDGNAKIETHQLSSGEKVLLIILMTALTQNQQHRIFFIDEPETSLHIEWQRKLIGFIRELNPNAQLIIATHSPAIIMEGWLDKVFEVSELIVNKEIAQ